MQSYRHFINITMILICTSILCSFPVGADLESLRSAFNEKEKELSLAVAKVDELTKQLEDVRKNSTTTTNNANNSTNNNKDGQQQQSTAALELEKLRRELMVSKAKDRSNIQHPTQVED
jgi:septal ring factor EnvC (AmiA/AmiB activator)